MEPFDVTQDMHAVPTPDYGYAQQRHAQMGAHVDAYPPQSPVTSSTCQNDNLGLPPGSHDLSMYPDTKGRDNHLRAPTGQLADMHAVPTPQHGYAQYGHAQVGAHVHAYPPQRPVSSCTRRNDDLGLPPCSHDVSMYPDTKGKDNSCCPSYSGPLPGQPAGMHAMPIPQYGYGQGHVDAHPPQPPISSSTRKNDDLGLPPCSNDLSMYSDTNGKDNYSGAPTGEPAASTPYYSANTHIPMSSYRPASYPPLAANVNISPGVASTSQQPATCQMNEQWWCLIFCWLTIPSIVASFLPFCRAGPRFPDRNYKRAWIGNVIAASVLTIVWIIAIGVGSANGNGRGGGGGGGGGGCVHSELAETIVCPGHRKLLFDAMLKTAASALAGSAS